MNLPISGAGAQFAYMLPALAPKAADAPPQGPQSVEAQPRGTKRSAASSLQAGARKRQQLMGAASARAECGAGSAHLTPQLSFQLEFAGAARQLLGTMMQAKTGSALLSALEGQGAGVLSDPARQSAIREGLQAIGGRCTSELGRMDALPAVPQTQDQSLRAARLAARSASANNGMREMHERLALMAAEALSLLDAMAIPAASAADDPVAFAAIYGAHEPYDDAVEEREPDKPLSSEQAFAAAHGAPEPFSAEAGPDALPTPDVMAATARTQAQPGPAPNISHGMPVFDGAAAAVEAESPEQFAQALSSLGHGSSPAGTQGSGRTARQVVPRGEPAQQTQQAQQFSAALPAPAPAWSSGQGQVSHEPPPPPPYARHPDMQNSFPLPPLQPLQPSMPAPTRHFAPPPGPHAPWQAAQQAWQAPHSGSAQQYSTPQRPARASSLLRMVGNIGGGYLTSVIREAGRFLGRFGLR